MSVRTPSCQLISIHALREEGDRMLPITSSKPCLFLSTPSARRATPARRAPRDGYFISIHALREEGDAAPDGVAGTGTKFLSTPSARRATLSGLSGQLHKSDFYPRPPRGGRRLFDTMQISSVTISIHALREEGDCRSYRSRSLR